MGKTSLLAPLAGQERVACLDLAAMRDEAVASGVWTKCSPSGMKREFRGTLLAAIEGAFFSASNPQTALGELVVLAERGATDKFHDLRLHLAMERESLSVDYRPATCHLTVSTVWLRDKERHTNLDDLCTRFFEAADATGVAHYGFCEVASVAENQSGSSYDTIFSSPTTWPRMVEHYAWKSLGRAKRDHVRGVYWGNYLSKHLLGRLKSADLIDRHYGDFVHTIRPGFTSLVTAMTSGARFIRTWPDPFDLSKHASIGGMPSQAAEFAAWLRRQFVASNVLA